MTSFERFHPQLQAARECMEESEFRRRARLAACALIRRFFPEVLSDDDAALCLSVAEDYADGVCDIRRREELRHRPSPLLVPVVNTSESHSRLEIGRAVLGPDHALFERCVRLERTGVEAAIRADVGEWKGDRAQLLRLRNAYKWTDAAVSDVYGELFRPPSAPVPDSVQSVSSATIEWARQIYDLRSYDELPVLADALEDQGYDDLAVLKHLREVRSHHRGCWALDAVVEASPGT